MSEEIQNLKTSCNQCIFAESKESVQTGCELGRLEIFGEQGRAELDEGGTFHVIQGVCNTCRGETWKDIHKNQDLVATVGREIQLPMDIVLYNTDEDVDIRTIEQSVSSCVKQKTIKPRKIMIAIKNSDINYQELYNILQDVTDSYEVPFQLVRIVEDDADINRCIAMGIDKCTSQFVAVFDIKYKIPLNFIEQFNEVINYKLQKVIMVEPTAGYNNMILQTGLFEVLGKNKGMPIFEKIKEIAQDQQSEQLILTWDQLWNRE